MKRSLSWLFATLLFISCGSGDNGAGPGGGNNNNPPTPQPTAVGAPDGGATSQTIGAAGGVVMSEDSVLTLNIPAGALAADTLITIQPITNTAWGGAGKGYRLTPDGLHFSTPVSLSFKVDPDSLEGTNSDVIDVAFQDSKGLWYILKNRSFDDGASRLTATTSHFTDYARVEGIQIRPARASVAPLGTVNLKVKYCSREAFNSGGDEIAALLITCDDELVPLGTFTNWAVNHNSGGTVPLGRVVSTGATRARYTAPEGVPLGNPVVVSVDFKNENGITKQLTSRITVIGGSYTGDITHITGSGAPGEKAVFHLTWTSLGINGGFEQFTATGTIDYTPPTLPCTTHTFSPTTAPILTSGTFMIIDRNDIPFAVTVTASAEWGVHECNDCGGTMSCEDHDFVAGFGDGGTGTVTADGKLISGSYEDLDTGEIWTYEFTRP
ncbi:MAG TPA: hypothetical protein VJS69_06930 [Candidatus Krumholzibacteria bacterium]|nr:hypothetical protein [Candidatus Krumholzibacteria bacterium]